MLIRPSYSCHLWLSPDQPALALGGPAPAVANNNNDDDTMPFKVKKSTSFIEDNESKGICKNTSYKKYNNVIT